MTSTSTGVSSLRTPMLGLRRGVAHHSWGRDGGAVLGRGIDARGILRDRVDGTTRVEEAQ